MKLKDMITNHSLITVQIDDSLDLALQVMLWGGVRHLPVLDGERLVGIVSQRDILFHQSKVGTRIAMRAQAKEVMSVPPITAGPEESENRARELMVMNKLGCIPVVEHGKLLGIVTRSDFLAHQVRSAEPEPGARAGERGGADGLKAAAIMKADLVTAAADDYLLDAVARMEAKGVRHLPVVDGEHRIVGMLSDRDVRTTYGNVMRPLGVRDAMVRLHSTRVANAMSRNPVTVPHSMTVSDLAHQFVDHRIGAVPVLDDDDRVMGMVSYVDVLRALTPASAAA